MKLFIKLVLWFMQYDMAIERTRLEHIKQCIAHDEARLHYWQLKLMALEAMSERARA